MSLSVDDLRRKFEQRDTFQERQVLAPERSLPRSPAAPVQGPIPRIDSGTLDVLPSYQGEAVRRNVRQQPEYGLAGADGEPTVPRIPPQGVSRAPQPTGRSTHTLRRAWVDPEETPFEPIPRPGNPFAARLISWVFTLMFLGAIAWLVVPEISFRLENADTVVLADGVLTAHPVPLAPTRPAIVTDLFVDASALPDGVLAGGTPIARLEGLSETSRGYEAFELRAPFDARFVSVDSLVGAVALPGTPVATVYDPSKMYVIVSVEPRLLEHLRRGMRVELKSSVIEEPVQGSVISAVPLLGTDHEPTSAELVNVRIKPDPEQIADFVPGIRFDAVVDLTSAPPNAQPLVLTNASHIATTAASSSQSVQDAGAVAEN